MVGIISNTAAMKAQSNLLKSSTDTASSIARLSSGARIDKASTDVAGLAIGTILQTNITTLRAAYTNTSQANSLLGIADGALDVIGSILQRQKALASQATSGSLSDSARGFLNQEFQSIKSEVDRIAGTANFNGIKLLDGSLYAPANITSDTRSNATQAVATLKLGATAVTAGTDTIAIAGSTITFVDITAGALATAPELNVGKVTDTGANLAADIMDVINGVLNYTPGSNTVAAQNTAILAAKNAWSKLNFSVNGATITITAAEAGTAGNAITFVTTVPGAAATFYFNGQDVQVVGAAPATLTNAAGPNYIGTPGVDGALNGGTANTVTTVAQIGSPTTAGTASHVIAQGTISDTLLNAALATGININNVSNNPAFIGTIQGFEAQYAGTNLVNLSIQVGAYTYTAQSASSNTAAENITFTSSGGGGSFVVQLGGAGTGVTVNSQSDANIFATRLNAAFNGVTFYQRRQLTNYTAAGTIFPTGSTTSNGDLGQSEFFLVSSNFTGLTIDDVSITAPVVGATDAILEFTISGSVYRSATGIGSNLATNSVFPFTSQDNPLDILYFAIPNTGTAISIANPADAQGVQAAFIKAFNIKNGGSGLSFQVGTAGTDTIEVQVRSAKTTDIYLDSNGNYSNPDISTLAGAVTANTLLDTSIDAVTSNRANIGAMQSRFNFAATSIDSSIQNQDAARSNFLDTNIPTESTAFAGAQVRLQASISVLAQANMLPRNLLALITNQ